MGTDRKSTSAGSSLFGKTRTAVLALLFGRPDENFYFRHICRSVRAGHGAVQRELKALSEAGIIRRTDSGRQVYYRADPSSPVYPELRSLMAKTAGLGDILRLALAPLAGRIAAVFIYGSLAEGKEKPGSDVDLMIVGDVTFSEVVLRLQGAQKELGREINPAVYSIGEYRARVREKQHFLTSVLKGKKIFLIGDQDELERLAPERLARRPRDESAGDR